MIEDLIEFLIRLIRKLISKIFNINNNGKDNQDVLYTTKSLMTNSELLFLNKLKYFEDNYKIIPQLNLATVVRKIGNNKYASELFRNIDFAIFTNDYSNLLLLIELNDKTHESKSRKKRDAKVKKICNEANIKLITFYTKYPNNEDYVVNRIINELNNNQNDE